MLRTCVVEEHVNSAVLCGDCLVCTRNGSVVLKVDLHWLDTACRVGILAFDFFNGSVGFAQIACTEKDGVHIAGAVQSLHGIQAKTCVSTGDEDDHRRGHCKA